MNTDNMHQSTPLQLAQLLGLAMASEDSPQDGDSGQRLVELLQDRLAGPLPMRSEVLEKLPVLLGKLQRGLLPGDGRAVSDLLMDAETSLKTLQTIKSYGKTLSRRDSSDCEHTIGVAIYYAAIASAVIFRNEKITSHPFSYLAASFDSLIEKPWLPGELARHFAKAKKVCRKKG